MNPCVVCGELTDLSCRWDCMGCLLGMECPTMCSDCEQGQEQPDQLEP